MNIGIVGLGLIGGSLGRAISKKTTHKVYAYDISSAVMQKGKLIEAYHQELTTENADELDILWIALYPNAATECMQRYAPLLKDGALIIDAAGNKRRVACKMKQLAEEYPSLHFIGAHPMAGKEFSGLAHASPALFDKASILVTPISVTIDALAQFKELSQQIGFGQMVITTPEEHDERIAFTSQLAHIVSSSYVKSPRAKDYNGFSAGSFKDMTRVARLNPDMWTELFMENKDNLIMEIDEIIKHISEYKNALCDGDEMKLKTLLKEGNEIKINL